jgi:hypothetical protein
VAALGLLGLASDTATASASPTTTPRAEQVKAADATKKQR